VSLGEYPTIRYYRPRDPLPTHESHVLCTFLAQAVQDEIDVYAKYHQDFPPQSNRPRGALYIVDRSMDLYAPFVHEFTYQAMAHDLLPIRDSEKVTYRTIVNEGRPDQEEKDMEIGEKDRIWVENRHRHMKDTIEKLMGDFQRFIDENPHFADPTNSNTSNLNVIKDMLAGLPEFQQMKEAYSLHLSMAQESMNVFQKHKLAELAALEQTLATGLDEDYKKPKNAADQTVRMLDEEAITPSDRLRLIALYLLYKDGLLSADIQKLRCHAQLPPQDEQVLRNLELLGARVTKLLKDQKPAPQRLFPTRPPAASNQEEELALSRFDPAVKHMLEDHIRHALDPTVFPFVKPDPSAHADTSSLVSSESLRTAKPTWADSKSRANKPRQRIIVFMAGGATYSEARACYEISNERNRDVVLVTSHMLTPGLWMRQLGDLSVDRRQLRLPVDQPAKKAPAHLFEKEAPPKPPAPAQPAVPTNAMAGMNLNGNAPARRPQQSAVPSRMESPAQSMHSLDSGRSSGGRLTKDKEKKKHHFFSSKK
jgi:syntaxin-binding protein 1